MLLWKTAICSWLVLFWTVSHHASLLKCQSQQELCGTFSSFPSSLDPPSDSLVQLVCQATRYPEHCVASLSDDPGSALANSTELVRIAINLGWAQGQISSNLVTNFLQTAVTDVNTTSAARVCKETLDYGSFRLSTSRDSFLVRPVQDIVTWMSAALQFQYDCFSALSNVVNPPETLTEDVLPQVGSTMEVISNGLCMTKALAAHGQDPTSWGPPPETRPGTILPIIASLTPDRTQIDVNDGESCSVLTDPLPNVTVSQSQDGSSDFGSLQEAIDNAPTYSSERYVIYVKEGIYDEIIRVHHNKTRITLVGDGASKTILTGRSNVSPAAPGVSTFQTATVVVVGDGFIAIGITFQNSAGPNVGQAVAIRVDSDESIFQDCLFDAFQDTLYAHTGRQLYRNCTILGTVDFIFGNSATVFQDCQLLVRPNRNTSTRSFVTAQGRTDPCQSTGFVFHSCTVAGTPEYMQTLGNRQAFLGRPWKQFSRTVFINSYLDALIDATGWYPWSGDFALNSLYYGEYNSSGAGATSLSSRVPWSSQMTQEQALYFSVDSFVQGHWWIPCANVAMASKTKL